MKKLLLTGATGFIGREIIRALKKYPSHEVFTTYRGGRKQYESLLEQDVNPVEIKDLSDIYNGTVNLSQFDIIIHTAAKAHLIDSPLSDYNQVNTEETRNLALKASQQGVRRLVFISSIGVNGTSSNDPFTPENQPAPQGNYAISKHNAEEALLELSNTSDLETVIIRPPLVYGPNAPGNFSRLVKLLSKGFPLPFGSLKNLRSFVGIRNLADFVCHASFHPKARNEIFLVSDGQDITVSNFMRKIGVGIGKTPNLIPFPPTILGWIFKLIGRSDQFDKMSCRLQLDIRKTVDLLGWEAPYSIDNEMKRLK